MNKQKCGLKLQALLALLLSLLIATAFFFLSNIGIELMLENFTEKTGYINERSNRYLDDFASFVERDKVAANDLSKIKKWHKAHKGYWTLLYIVRNGEVLFDSLQYSRYYDPEESQHSGGAIEEIEENYVKNEWFYNRVVSFADGSATVAFYGNFDVWLSTIALVGELILSVVLMCIVFALFIRKKINYIIELKEGVGVLETGGLSYPIPVRGKDELSGLADGLNQMRLALLETMQAQAEAAQTKYDLAVGVSHDLRTPLTAAALYLDLVAEDKYETEEQRDTYLRRCREKLLQIKQMTDRLFDRFSSEESKPEPLPTQTVFAAFEDVLSNTVSYLEENGFTVFDSIHWPEQKVAVSSESINRVFDNISSNLLKYADRDEPVSLQVTEIEDHLQIMVENGVIDKKPSDSTGIGLSNIESLMNKMHGSCRVERRNNRFIITLCFPLQAE